MSVLTNVSVNKCITVYDHIIGIGAFFPVYIFFFHSYFCFLQSHCNEIMAKSKSNCKDLDSVLLIMEKSDCLLVVTNIHSYTLSKYLLQISHSKHIVFVNWQCYKVKNKVCFNGFYAVMLMKDMDY